MTCRSSVSHWMKITTNILTSSSSTHWAKTRMLKETWKWILNGLKSKFLREESTILLVMPGPSTVYQITQDHHWKDHTRINSIITGVEQTLLKWALKVEIHLNPELLLATKRDWAMQANTTLTKKVKNEWTWTTQGKVFLN